MVSSFHSWSVPKCSDLSHCNTWIRLLYLVYDVEVMLRKKKKTHFFFVIILADKTWVLDQSEGVQGLILISIIIVNK